MPELESLYSGITGVVLALMSQSESSSGDVIINTLLCNKAGWAYKWILVLLARFCICNIWPQSDFTPHRPLGRRAPRLGFTQLRG